MNTPARTSRDLAPPTDAGSLAHEMARARNQLIAYYQKQYKLSPEAAMTKVDELTSPTYVQSILATPARETSWWGLDQLAAADPELAARRWEEIKEEARAELLSGHRAATAVEASTESCWERAQFLAFRDELARQWRPRNGIEWTLVDLMAQAWTLQSFWMQRLVMVDAIEWPEPPSKEMAKWQPPRLTSSMAIDQAAAMVDRFNRIFMRALRQLRDLRRYTVVIQGAEQVNIGQNQVNLAPTSDGADVEAIGLDPTGRQE